MRLAFVFLTYGKNVFGGIENALYNLTQGLKDIGHDACVFTSGTYVTSSSRNLPAKAYISKYLPTKYDGKVSNLIQFLENNSENINSDFDNFLQNCKPDYIIAVDPIWGILPVTKYKFDSEIPFAISYHVANKWQETKELMHHSFGLPFDKFFSVSEFLSDEIRSEFFESRDITFNVLPNSIDIGKYTYRNSSNKKYIFCNSRIAKGKNVDVLVEAFAKALKGRNIRLKLCLGNFPFGVEKEENEKINKLISNYGIEKSVDLLPSLEWESIPEIVSNATLIVLPSTYETFGIAALEASVAGTPLIVARATNFKNLVEKSAMFFEPNNLEDLTNKVLEVLDNYTYYKELALKHSIQYKAVYDNRVVAERLINELHTNNLL
ncbi:MAG: glycosyltransferase family 4 protein [Patescibacteria group bacterium]